MFLSAPQRQSERLAAELGAILPPMLREGRPIDLVAAVSTEEARRLLEGRQKDWGLEFPVRIDPQYGLWGTLGIVATPTVILADREGSVSWIYAGYGHDFGEAFRSELSQALGLVPPKPFQSARDLIEPAVEDRARRHVKVANLLAQEGHRESAVAEIRKAAALAPAAVEFQIDLGDILCQVGEAQEAVSVLSRIEVVKAGEKARVRMLTGWAYRQLGNLEAAEKLLRESLEADGSSVRALYELGKIHEARGEKERAMELYRRALATQFRETVPAPR